jgi:hypothetical protein
MQQLKTSREVLKCRTCGATFPEARATDDGWTYACPEPDCDASGLGGALHQVD